MIPFGDTSDLLHLHHLGFACFHSNNPDGSFYLFAGIL
ncbi:hypothetical protein B4071_4126 [Bacillus subtilis]|nr:hypothetical protein B4069_4101 [Bacillus subtilis]KIN42348.1 hypothetical protein B4071_4126 [Bacillus subtilis]KIN45988.1 hypothetical protein B4072_4097 [Bacillus subtilis]